jgi:calcineurin-like phosphoesterase family protein
MKDILFSHYPLSTTIHSKPKEVANVEFLQGVYEANGCTKVIHGHTHNRNIELDNHFNCSVEQINYTPIELNTFLGV